MSVWDMSIDQLFRYATFQQWCVVLGTLGLMGGALKAIWRLF